MNKSTESKVKKIIIETVLGSKKIKKEKKDGLVEFITSLSENDLKYIVKGTKLLEAMKKMSPPFLGIFPTV